MISYLSGGNILRSEGTFAVLIAVLLAPVANGIKIPFIDKHAMIKMANIVSLPNV